MSKIGFVSDIHSNIEALESVLSFLEGEKCDSIICLGDVVGYGGAPKECIRRIRELKIPTVKGNHDDYVSDIFGTLGAHLREEVKKAIGWTQSKLDFDEVGWLGDLPMQLDFDGFSVIHSSFARIAWSYCLDEDSFASSFTNQKMKLAFCGHSHRPLIGVDVPDESKPFVDYIRSQAIPEEYKTMVNVGSVGQPRDRDPRACTVIYDTDTRGCFLHRVEYDIESAQKRIMAAGLPERFAARLSEGR